MIIAMSDSIRPNVTVTQAQIGAFCRTWKIVQFEPFGSILRDDFRPDSDVDVLVTFEKNAPWTFFDVIHMEDDLKELFARDVDLVERPSIEQRPNWVRRRNILSSARRVYAA